MKWSWYWSVSGSCCLLLVCVLDLICSTCTAFYTTAESKPRLMALNITTHWPRFLWRKCVCVLGSEGGGSCGVAEDCASLLQLPWLFIILDTMRPWEHLVLHLAHTHTLTQSAASSTSAYLPSYVLARPQGSIWEEFWKTLARSSVFLLAWWMITSELTNVLVKSNSALAFFPIIKDE